MRGSTDPRSAAWVLSTGPGVASAAPLRGMALYIVNEMIDARRGLRSATRWLVVAAAAAILVVTTGCGRETRGVFSAEDRCGEWSDDVYVGDTELTTDQAQAANDELFVSNDETIEQAVSDEFDVESCEFAAELGVVGTDGSVSPLGIRLVGRCAAWKYELYDIDERALSPAERADHEAFKKRIGRLIPMESDIRRQEFEERLETQFRDALRKKYGRVRGDERYAEIKAEEAADRRFCRLAYSIIGPTSRIGPRASRLPPP